MPPLRSSQQSLDFIRKSALHFQWTSMIVGERKADGVRAADAPWIKVYSAKDLQVTDLGHHQIPK
jgi:hypothetical protein